MKKRLLESLDKIDRILEKLDQDVKKMYRENDSDDEMLHLDILFGEDNKRFPDGEEDLFKNMRFLDKGSLEDLDIEEFWSLLKECFVSFYIPKIHGIVLGFIHNLLSNHAYVGKLLIFCEHDNRNELFVDIDMNILETYCENGVDADHDRKNGVGKIKVIDDIINTICNNYYVSCTNNQLSDHIILHYMKIFITIFSSSEVEVHGGLIKKVIDTNIDIHIRSKTRSIKTASFASLVQITDIIFRKIDEFFSLLSTGGLDTNNSTLEDLVKVSLNSAKKDHFVSKPGIFGSCFQCNDSASCWHISKECALCSYHALYLYGNKPYELAYDESLVPETSRKCFWNSVLRSQIQYYRVLCDDGKLVFETFVKMLKAHAGSDHDEKLVELCLEAILSVLKGVKGGCCSNNGFIDILRSDLFSILLCYAQADSIKIYKLCFSIFLTLIKSFRVYMKVQIETLFVERYLIMFESNCSDHAKKEIFLDGLHDLFVFPQLLLDLYVNYDCDISADSLYEHIILLLGNICQYNQCKYQQGSCESHGFYQLENETNPQPLCGEDDGRVDDQEKTSRMTSMYMSRSHSHFNESSRIELSHIFYANRGYSGHESDHGTAALKCFNAIITSLYLWIKDYRLKDDGGRKPSTTEIDNKPLEDFGGLLLMEKDMDFAKIIESKNKKQCLKQGIYYFNHKNNPKAGIEYLQEHNIIENTTEGIVKFLLNTKGLDKEAIGLYLGEPDEEILGVMHAYVDSLDFADMDFVNSLRYLLTLFRLPGESQKIDRMMEKFADRFCECNAGVFSNADTAYVLAYSIIMLNTDLHSKSIKNKISKTTFVKNNLSLLSDTVDSGVNEEFLSSVYDNILAEEIVLDESYSYFKSISNGVFHRKTHDKSTYGHGLNNHFCELGKGYSNGMKVSIDQERCRFRTATKSEHVVPMVELLSMVLYNSLLDSYMRASDATEKERMSLQLTLSCMVEVIKLSNLLGLDSLIDRFVGLLSKFTYFETPFELKLKDIWATKTLLHIVGPVCDLGNHLSVFGWLEIFSCISRLDKWRLIEAPIDCSSSKRNKNAMDENLDRGNNPHHRSVERHVNGMSEELFMPPSYGKSISSFAYFRKKTLSISKLRMLFQELDILRHIDFVFSNSITLDGHSILRFFHALCFVSLQEFGICQDDFKNTDKLECKDSIILGDYVSQSCDCLFDKNLQTNDSTTPPRIYSLQKIVEVAYYNMNRIRLEWNHIWRILQPHFNKAGLHFNLKVCIVAIDSLRQLSVKFFEKDELSHYNTQNELLKPFEYIMKNTNYQEVGDLILSSFDQMISTKAKNIKSGWKTIFNVLRRSFANSTFQRGVFILLHKIRAVCFRYIIYNGFIDYIYCLTELVSSSQHENLSIEALRELKCCYLDLKTMTLEEKYSVYNSSRSVSNEVNIGCADGIREYFYSKWFPMLLGVSQIISTPQQLFIKSQAISLLFKMLNVVGNIWSNRLYWKSIYRCVLIPIFEDILYDDGSTDDRKKMCFYTDAENIYENIARQKDFGDVCEDKHTLNKRETWCKPVNCTKEWKVSDVSTTIWIEVLRLWVDLISSNNFLLVVEEEELKDQGSDDEPLVECVYSCFLHEFLNLLTMCVKTCIEHLSQSSILCVYHIVQRNRVVLGDTEWSAIIGFIIHLLDWSGLEDLLSMDIEHIESINLEEVTFRCSLHLSLIQLVRGLNSFGYPPVQTEENAELNMRHDNDGIFYRQGLTTFNLTIEALSRSNSFAVEFNSNTLIREKFVSGKGVFRNLKVDELVLVKQEIHSISVLWYLLLSAYRFHMMNTNEEACWKHDDVVDYIIYPLRSHTEFILNNFLTIVRSMKKRLSSRELKIDCHMFRELRNWIPIIIVIFQEFLGLKFLYDVDNIKNQNKHFSLVRGFLKILAMKGFDFLQTNPFVTHDIKNYIGRNNINVQCRTVEIIKTNDKYNEVCILSEKLNETVINFMRQVQDCFIIV